MKFSCRSSCINLVLVMTKKQVQFFSGRLEGTITISPLPFVWKRNMQTFLAVSFLDKKAVKFCKCVGFN